MLLLLMMMLVMVIMVMMMLAIMVMMMTKGMLVVRTDGGENAATAPSSRLVLVHSVQCVQCASEQPASSGALYNVFNVHQSI